jgi:hypothetical protein
MTAIMAAATMLFSAVSPTTLAAYADSDGDAKLKALPKESLVDDGSSQLLKLKFKLQEGDFLEMIRVSVDGTMVVEFDAEGTVLNASPAFEFVIGDVTMLSDGYAIGPAKGKFAIAMNKLALGEGEHEAVAEVILDGDILVADAEFELKPSEPALPDLVAKYLVAPTTIRKQLNYWTFTIERNEGTDDAKSHFVKLYLSKDNSLSPSDELLGLMGVGKLEVGDFDISPIQFKLEKKHATGMHTLFVKVDATDKVEEQSESNNVLSKQANILESGLHGHDGKNHDRDDDD